jgi:hypothetical protein
MADLGTIATDSFLAKETLFGTAWTQNGAMLALTTLDSVGYAPRYALRGVVLEDEMNVLVIGTGSSSTEGDPNPPSLRMDAQGIFKFRWSVSNNGTRSISVKVKQSENQNPRPMLRVKANSSIGLLNDATAVAPNGTSWVTIGTVAIAPTQNGAVWVHLENRYDGQAAPCFWDHITTT